MIDDHDDAGEIGWPAYIIACVATVIAWIGVIKFGVWVSNG